MSIGVMKTTEQNADVGVIVTRFQSPFLHKGHQEIIELVRNAHPRVIIVLGLSPLKCTANNPFDFGIRKAMVEEKYKDIEVLYLNDVGDNEIWSKNLDKLISQTIGPKLKAVLYGSRDSFINSYKGNFPTIGLVPMKYISTSEIRRRIGIKAKPTQDFREGIVYATQNQFPSFKLTVDSAVVNYEKKELLLARKPNRTTLCFIGGFTDPSKDKSAEEAVIRETQEESGLIVTEAKYVGSTFINDWRYRAEQDKIMTILFALRYAGGTPKANDDIEYVTWKKFGEITEAEVSPSHWPLLRMLDAYFNGEVIAKTNGPVSGTTANKQ